MAAPWEKYGQAAPSAQSPAAPAPPPFIGGVTTPRQASAEARANEDQAMQREANARAAAAADRQAAAAERAAAAADRTAIKDAKGTESERTAGFLAGRIVDGIGRMSTSVQADSAAASPTMGVEAVRGVFGDTAANYMTDPQRQQVRAAQMDILDAALTLGTGAAYTKEQLEGYRTSYFPQLGDDASTVASKQQALRSLIVNAQTKAGSASPDIEKALAALDAMSAAGGQVAPKPEGESVQYSQELPGGLTGTVTDDSPTTPSGGGGGGQNPYLTGLAAGVGDIVEGALDIPGLLANPVGAALNSATGGKYFSTDIGRDARNLLDLPLGNETAGEIIQGGTGALTGSLAGRGAGYLANPGAWQNALAQFGATPGRDMLAGAGAVAGGQVGQQIGGVPGQIIGTLAGGVTGYGGGNALARLAGPRQANATMQAADDLGITMLPADVGGTGTRMASGATKMTLGGIPMAEAAEKSIGSAAAARGNIAREIGQVTDNAGAGQAAKRGFEGFDKSSLARSNELYEKVSVDPKSNVQLANTRGALSEVTRGMESNPELSKLWANHPRLRATLEALTPKDVSGEGRKAFTEASERLMAAQERHRQLAGSVANPAEVQAAREAVEQAGREVQAAKEMAERMPEGGNLSWEDMKRFRSIVGEIIGQPGIQRDGSDIAALRKLYGAISTDMEVTAAQSGPKALREFNRATQYWRGRESRIDDVFATLLGKDGKRSDESVFRQINSWANGEKGDFSRIARMIRSMPEDEANTIRATLIQRMGMATPANGGAEVFSPANFSTQWRSLSGRAKNVLFPNQQHRQDLEKLAEVTGAMKRADEYANTSKTSLGVNLTGHGALAWANLPAAVALAATEFGIGKLLSSPKVARILASSVKMQPEAAAKFIPQKLALLASREPAIANDLNGLAQYLEKSFGQSPVRAAARDEEQN